jgi:hypothetical protein
VVNFRDHSIAVTIIVTFSISFGLMWWQRNTQGVALLPMPESTPTVAVSSPPSTVPISMPPPLEERKNPVVPRRTEAPRIQPVVSDPSLSEGAFMQPMPVTIHVWNRPGQHKIEGAVQNISGTAMTVTARVENPTTHETSEFQLDINPGETKSFSTDSGLEIYPHDHITFQSPPYQDKVSIVP